MSDRNPHHVRFAPGKGPVPESQQIPDEPSDSAQWMDDEPQGYEDGPLFPEENAPAQEPQEAGRSVLDSLLGRKRD